MTIHGTVQHTFFLGIDPGLTGSLAVIDESLDVVALHDTPILSIKASRGTKQQYDLPGMAQLLRPYTGPGAHVILEESQAMPGQGVRFMFTIGLGFGAWLGLLGALEIPYTRVRPAVWKQALGLRGRDKEGARLRAQQLFPGADLSLKKHHGRAEGLLLAHWGRLRVSSIILSSNAHFSCPPPGV